MSQIAHTLVSPSGWNVCVIVLFACRWLAPRSFEALDRFSSALDSFGFVLLGNGDASGHSDYITDDEADNEKSDKHSISS
jgi:hypothetical protein